MKKEPMKIAIVGDGVICSAAAAILAELAVDFEVDVIQVSSGESLKGLEIETMCFDEILTISEDKSDLSTLFSELKDVLDNTVYYKAEDFDEISFKCDDRKVKHSHPHWHKGRW